MAFTLFRLYDWDAVGAFTFRSHSEDDVEEALHSGEKVWGLDTEGAGDDDVLIGERADVLSDVAFFFAMDESEIEVED